MQGDELFALVFITGMFAGVFIVIMGLRQRSQQLQMQHLERMAMIERGHIPLSEPAASRPPDVRYAPGGAASSRSLSVGILVIGFGIALMTIISIAAESPEVGVGIGGAVAILGAAFVVRSIVVKPDAPPARLARPSALIAPPSLPVPPPTPSAPPPPDDARL